MFMQKYTYIYWMHTDAMITDARNDKDRRRKTSLTKYLPLTLLQEFEKVAWGFTVRGSWRPNITAIFWPPILWPSTMCLSCSSDAQPEPWGPLCWMLAFFTASYQHLLWTSNSIGIPGGPLGRVWLSLPLLVSNRLPLNWHWPELQLYWLSNSTQSYNRSTPTRSLKSNV